MTNITQYKLHFRRAVLDGILLSTPTLLALLGLAKLVLSQYQLISFPILIVAIPLLGVFVQLQHLRNEDYVYQQQLKRHALFWSERESVANNLATFFLYLCNLFGLIFLLFGYVLSSHSVNAFIARLPVILGILVALCFIVGFLGLFFVVMIKSVEIMHKNYGGHTVVPIRLSELEILGSGSKQFRFTVEAMVYGDLESTDNLKIINNNVLQALPGFRDQLQREKAVLEERSQELARSIEEACQQDSCRALKAKLPALHEN